MDKEKNIISFYHQSNTEIVLSRDRNMNKYIARPGQTESNSENRICGITDIDLTHNREARNNLMNLCKVMRIVNYQLP